MWFRFEQRRVGVRPNLIDYLPTLRTLICLGSISAATLTAISDEHSDPGEFQNQIRPILQEYCFDCHADGANKGKVAFDSFNSESEVLADRELWQKALKNIRAGLMPPPRKPQPTPAQKKIIEKWIKSSVFESDPQNPDPGRVTIRRLNRVEYHNTIRDLMGIDFETEKEFPSDDSGYGFDNIGDVLTLPPMLLEKYFAAAKAIVAQAVPSVSAVPAEIIISGRSFKGLNGSAASRPLKNTSAPSGLVLSYYESAAITNTFSAPESARYQLLVDFVANEKFVDNQFDYNKSRLTFRVDGQDLLQHDYSREGGKTFHYEFDQDWKAGQHELGFFVQPLTPDQKQVRSLTLRIDSVTVRGPLDKKYWVRPRNYARFFPKQVPSGAPERRQYARTILEPFLFKSYRRPIDPSTLDRLVALAESTYTQEGKTFEAGISQAMVAVLASPRFLFREEEIESANSAPAAAAGRYGAIDEFALASRLSYFLWSSMPDDELLNLALKNELRRNLAQQTKRLLADPKSEALVRNFVGQWLQVRDVETIPIDARQVLQREAAVDPELERRRRRLAELRDKDETRITPEEKIELDEIRAAMAKRFARAPRVELNGELRRAMRLETEKTFEYILRQDRSLLELIQSDYTFLNERLATHYGMTNLNVEGDELRLVKLPFESSRGGVITQGSVLAVTSNPTRTSPVKRGLFILDNLLGTPPPPPPPDIPPLEDASKKIKDRPVTLRETLALHREKELCSSCHNRMDPLGLALEHFNALGMWRDQERGEDIDASGKLLSGETFGNVQELKQILVSQHADEFYRTISEKLLTYALGRGLEYYDVSTVDHIVDGIKRANGHASALLSGIIESAPFQKSRTLPATESAKPTGTERADLKRNL